MNEPAMSSHFDNIREIILKEIYAARHCIYIAVAWFTDQEIIDAIAEKSTSVSVQVIVSRNEYNERQRFIELIKNGGELYYMGGSTFMDHQFMHNKFCVIDYETVITGSYNWTKNASNNEENIVLLRDKLIAGQYTDQFLNLIRQSGIENLDVDNPIKISFLSSQYIVNKSQEVSIHWKVENADTVNITKIGTELNFIGEHKLLIYQDTILKMEASNPDFIKTKTIKIRLLLLPEILSFILSDKATIQGRPITISWETKNALSVEINNGIGKVEKIGSIDVVPAKDTVYTIKAIGEDNHEITKGEKLIVFPRPTISTFDVPLPTKIELETDISIFKTQIPSEIIFSNIKSGLAYNTPKLQLLRSEVINTHNIYDISKVSGKLPHELITEKINKNQGMFKWLMSNVFKALENTFKKDIKASQVISQIKKSYNL